MSKDIASLRSFALGRTNRLFEISEIDISQLLYDKFNLRNATSTTFTLLLNHESPAVTISGKPIDGSHLKFKSNKFFGTFAPVASEYQNLNIAKIIYPYPERDGDFSSQTTFVELEANLLSEECVQHRQLGDVPEFLMTRSAIVARKVHLLTGCQVKYSLSGEVGREIDLIDDDAT